MEVCRSTPGKWGQEDSGTGSANFHDTGDWRYLRGNFPRIGEIRPLKALMMPRYWLRAGHNRQD